MTHNYNNVSFDLEQLNYLEIVCKGLETSQLFLVFCNFAYKQLVYCFKQL